jgi:hypothetical protein
MWVIGNSASCVVGWFLHAYWLSQKDEWDEDVLEEKMISEEKEYKMGDVTVKRK